MAREQLTFNDTGRDVYAETTAGEHAVSLKPVLRILWKRLWVIVLVATLLTGAVVGFSLSQTPQYEASSKILVGREGGLTENPNDVLGLQQLTLTMAEAVYSRPVAKGVIQELDLQISPKEFLENLSVEQVPDTQFIEVTYTDDNPETAKRIVNATGTVFSQQVADVSANASAITATVWEQAATPSDPVSPNPLRDGLVAMVLGILLGLGIAFLLEYLDDSWQSPEEAEVISGVPTLGVIPEFKAVKKNKEGG